MSILDERYVALTTFRKNGTPVATPVWIVKLDERTGGFYTDVDSGKMKRIRNNPKVALQACTVRGKLKPDSSPVAATAAIVEGSSADAVRTAISRKYAVMTKFFAIGKFFAKLLRRPQAPTCCVHLTLG